MLPWVRGGFFVGIAKEDIPVTIGFVRFPVDAMFPNTKACTVGIMIKWQVYFQKFKEVFILLGVGHGCRIVLYLLVEIDSAFNA